MGGGLGVEDGGAWRLNGEPSGGLRKRSNESFVLYPPPSVFMMIPRERKSGWDISSRSLIAKGTKRGGGVPCRSFNSPSGIPQEDDCKLSLQHPKGQLFREAMKDENPPSEWKVKLNANELDTMGWEDQMETLENFLYLQFSPSLFPGGSSDRQWRRREWWEP